MKLSTFVDHAEKAGKLNSRDLVEIILFFKIEVEGLETVSASDVRSAFGELSLPVPTRVSAYLSEGKSSDRKQYVKSTSGYSLHRNTKKRLTEFFLPVREVLVPEIGFEIIPSDFVKSRSYLVTLTTQINGCYSYGFYDGTAALMRRLMESLLIECFEVAGKSNLIKDTDGAYKMLKAIITQAKNPSNLGLSRNSPDVMDSVKDLGDAAAHSRHYITSKSDIDLVQTKYRRLITELCTKANVS